MEEGHEVVGIDLSKNLIKEAKKRVPKGKFYQMDMLEMKFCDETFDGIWCHATLCHILKLDAPKALKEMFRILKPDGVLYIGLREGEGEKMVCYLKSGNLPKFFAFYSQIELEELIWDAGFDILNSYSERDEQSAWINVFARKKGIKTEIVQEKKVAKKTRKIVKKKKK
jgi:SAM-dependent methyltransferase